MADEENKSKFMDILARGAEGAVDGFAKKSPIIGGAIQAAANTDEYQARQTERQAALQANKEFLQNASYRADQQRFAQEQRDAERQKMAEYASRKETRDKVDAATRARAEADAMKAEEEKTPEARAARMSAYTATTEQNKLSAKVNQYKQDQIDSQFMDDMVAGGTENFIREISNLNSGLNDDEIAAFANSPAAQNLIRGKVYLEQILKIGAGDQGAFGFMDRELHRNGMKLVDGENGMKYLDVGGGILFPANQAGVDQIKSALENNGMREFYARQNVCMENTLGNPNVGFVARYVPAYATMFKDSYADSEQYVYDIFKNASPAEQVYALFGQALRDYANPNVPMSAKMASVTACAPFLKNIGWAADGLDPKDPNIEKIRFVNGKDEMSFLEFAEYLKQHDTLSARLDDDLSKKMIQYGRATMMQAIQNEKDTAKAVEGEGGEETTEQASQKRLDDIWAMFNENEEFWNQSDEAQEKVVTAFDRYTKNATALMKRFNAKDEMGIPSKQLYALDDFWQKRMDGAKIDSGSGLRRSPVRGILDELEKAHAEYDRQKTEYEEQNATTTTRNETMQLGAGSNQTVRRTIKTKGKVPNELRLKQEYRSAEEELEDLKKLAMKLTAINQKDTTAYKNLTTLGKEQNKK